MPRRSQSETGPISRSLAISSHPSGKAPASSPVGGLFPSRRLARRQAPAYINLVPSPKNRYCTDFVVLASGCYRCRKFSTVNEDCPHRGSGDVSRFAEKNLLRTFPPVGRGEAEDAARAWRCAGSMNPIWCCSISICPIATALPSRMSFWRWTRKSASSRCPRNATITRSIAC